jgi:hypothetical protein
MLNTSQAPTSNVSPKVKAKHEPIVARMPAITGNFVCF